MTTESISDENIELLISQHKTVLNPRAREKPKATHLQRNYNLISDEGSAFKLYTRQNTIVSEHFSCGLLWAPSNDVTLTLLRYNGPHHPHINKIEKTKSDFECHIHRATARYIVAGKQAEGYAEVTTRYSDLQGALICLINDCNISGFGSEHTQTNMDLLH